MTRLLVVCAFVLCGTPIAAQTPPYPTAPACPTHNSRVWHGLWDAVRGCHYDHHHGDNPRAVDDLFGPSLFRLMGGEISHPWQTFSDSGTENQLKHAGYFWHVRRDIPRDPNQAAWVKHFRVLVHQHPTGRDAEVRFHSGVLEAVVTDTTGEDGYIQIPGMWIDFGDLVVDGVTTLDVGTTNEPGRHKQHSATNPQIIWYGANEATHTPDARGRIPRGFVSISTSVHDMWDHTNPAAPSATTDYTCYPNPRCRANATVLRPHLIAVHMPRLLWPLLDPEGDGVANWEGYTDRYGVPVSSCGGTGLDCVPVIVRNIKTNLNYGCSTVCGQSYRDYDIYFNRVSAGWNQPVP
jgi:hypothetical protein